MQALVLAPTRELARQTETVLLSLGDYMKVNVFLVVGGEKVRDMMSALNSGVHVVVGKDFIFIYMHIANMHSKLKHFYSENDLAIFTNSYITVTTDTL